MGQDASAGTDSNLRVLQRLIGRLGIDIVRAAAIAHQDSMQIVALGPTDERWVVEQAIAASLRNSFVIVAGDSLPAGSGRVRFELLPRLAITYGKSVASNIFGVTSVERTGSVTFEYRLIRGGQNATILRADTVSASQTDTVAVSDIPSLENQAIRASQAKPPSGSFLDSVAEPLIITGTVGTIIYLLFHIRS